MLNLFSTVRHFLLCVSSLLIFFPKLSYIYQNNFQTYIKIDTFRLIRISFIYPHFWKDYV